MKSQINTKLYILSLLREMPSKTTVTIEEKELTQKVDITVIPAEEE
ncbi:MAG: hypothetical protein IJ690_07095 [Clostridia bacterium]|nr:hypothetical protein [Clostridia bacterium]